MRQFRVAIAVPVFPNLMQTYIINQLVTFKTMGVKFLVLATGKKVYDPTPQVISQHKLLDDVTYINPTAKNIIKELLSTPLLSAKYWKNIIQLLVYRGTYYGLNYRLKSLLRVRLLVKEPFDIMHSHSLFSSYHYLFIKDIFALPIITTYHGQVPVGVKKLPQSMLTMVLEKVDMFIVNTPFAKKELIELGCDTGKIHIIPQGTNLKNFPFRTRKITSGHKIKLLTVGRLSKEKGHHIAIRAIAELIQVFPNIEYHIVGEGPEKIELDKLCQQEGIRNNIIFHGFKTGNDLLQLFSTAHIFMLPSINTEDGYLVETQGVVLQEAQASGLPIIGSRTGGIPDVIIENMTGLLFDEGDYRDLAKKIKTLIRSPDLYQRLCKSGRRDVEEKYDIDVVCNQLLSLYETALNR